MKVLKILLIQLTPFYPIWPHHALVAWDMRLAKKLCKVVLIVLVLHSVAMALATTWL